jgi:hypothetical protein
VRLISVDPHFLELLLLSILFYPDRSVSTLRKVVAITGL